MKRILIAICALTILLSGIAVAASMVTGFATTFVWKLWIRPDLKASTGFDLYELVPAFVAAFAVALLVSWWRPRRDEEEQVTAP